jgi:hypothetical protein
MTMICSHQGSYQVDMTATGNARGVWIEKGGIFIEIEVMIAENIAAATKAIDTPENIGTDLVMTIIGTGQKAGMKKTTKGVILS